MNVAEDNTWDDDAKVLHISYGLPNVWIITRTEHRVSHEPNVTVVALSLSERAVEGIIKRDVELYWAEAFDERERELLPDGWIVERYPLAACVLNTSDSVFVRTITMALGDQRIPAPLALLIAEFAHESPITHCSGDGCYSSGYYQLLVRWETHAQFLPRLWIHEQQRR